MEIEKKIWPKPFERILMGEKKYELRLADFEVKSGDILVLREFDPQKREYTGRELRKTVKHVSKTKDMKYWTEEDVNKFGFQIMSI